MLWVRLKRCLGRADRETARNNSVRWSYIRA